MNRMRSASRRVNRHNAALQKSRLAKNNTAQEQPIHRHFEDTIKTRRKSQLRFAAKCKFKLQQNTNSFCRKTPGVFCGKTKLQVAAKRKRILQQNENTRLYNPKNPESLNNRPLNEFVIIRAIQILLCIYSGLSAGGL